MILVFSGSRTSSHQKKGIKVSFPLFSCLVFEFEGDVGVEVNPRVGFWKLELCSGSVECSWYEKCQVNVRKN